MNAEIAWFGATLLLLLVSIISLIYWVFPGPQQSDAKKFESRIEYSILTLGSGICLLIVLLMA